MITSDLIHYEMLPRGLAVGALAASIIGWRQGGASRDAQIAGALFLACPSPFSAYSFDLGEAAVMAIFVPLWVIAVPTPWPALGLFMLHQLARNTIGHSGYELMPATAAGRPMFDWITSTTHHDLHHERGMNYGLYFTWWDRWMGAEHPEYHARFAAAVRKRRVGALVAAE